MNSTEVVRYEPALKRQVIDLQSHLWSPSIALNTAYFEWKYERNPYVAESLIYLAMRDGKAIGMRGFFGMQWEVGIPIQKTIVLYPDDLVIAPEHRNRGLIPQIMARAFEDLAKRNYQYVFNLSAGPITLLSSLAMGWRSVGSMQPMRRRSWRATLRSYRNRLTARLPMLFQKDSRIVPEWIEKRRPSLADVDTEYIRRKFRDVPSIQVEGTPRCAAMAGLVERIGGSRIRHVRDAEYFQWRFQNPLSRYRFLFWANSRLEGYLVLQEYTSTYANKEVVNIVDWEATSVTVHAELLQAAMRLAVGRHLAIWSVNSPPQTAALLDKAGFKLEPQPKSGIQDPRMLLVRPIRNENLDGQWLFAGQPLLDMKSWDLRMLYSTRG